MPNSRVARPDETLLPYHSHVVPEVVVGALNHLIDEVALCTPVFHEI